MRLLVLFLGGLLGWVMLSFVTAGLLAVAMRRVIGRRGDDAYPLPLTATPSVRRERPPSTHQGR